MTQIALPTVYGDPTQATDSWPGRFTPVAQALHWITALLMLIIVVLGWYMKALPRDLPTRQGWYDLHEAVGVTILVLTALRLAWRWANPPPPMPGHLGRVEQGVAALSHLALYFVLLAMPVSGYLLTSAAGHDLHYFGLFTLPAPIQPYPALAGAARTIHDAGQWAVYALVVLHVLATLWHVVFRRDGVLDRMLPPQDGRGPAS
jgi:cytochrome b561